MYRIGVGREEGKGSPCGGTRLAKGVYRRMGDVEGDNKQCRLTEGKVPPVGL